MPYPALPKISDNNTLLNFNVQKDGNDVTNTFISLIIMEKDSNKSINSHTSFMNLLISLIHIRFKINLNTLYHY